MYENFVLRKFEKGILEGYIWHVDNPDKVICIVHGIGEYGGRFDRVAERFRQCNMAVISLDLRGHGNSLGKKGHCAPRKDVLDDVGSLVEYAQERYGKKKKIILYGHSMGGNIVMDYRNRGDKNGDICGYIVSAPWIRLVRPVPGFIYSIVKLISKIAPEFTISSEVNEADLGHPESVKPYRGNRMIHNRISALCAVEGFETGLKLENGTLENNGNAHNIPTLLMHGGKDKICSVYGSRKISERLKSEGDNIEYKEWPELYHEIHNGGSKSRGDEVIEKAVKWAENI